MYELNCYSWFTQLCFCFHQNAPTWIISIRMFSRFVREADACFTFTSHPPFQDHINEWDGGPSPLHILHVLQSGWASLYQSTIPFCSSHKWTLLLLLIRNSNCTFIPHLLFAFSFVNFPGLCPILVYQISTQPHTNILRNFLTVLAKIL